MTRGLVIGSAAALVSVVLLSFVAGSDASRSGQVLFVPGPAPAAQILDERLGGVTVTACEVTPTGLKVLGYVPTGPERIVVLVSPGDPQDAGLSTGRGEWDHVHGPGSVIVTLPWASRASRIQIVDPEFPASPGGRVRVGRAVTCPEPDGTRIDMGY